MASTLVAIFIFISAFSYCSSNFVALDCPKEVVGQFGQQLVLKCVVKPTQDDAKNVNLDLVSVFWEKAQVSVLEYNKNTKEPGHFFAKPIWNAKDVNVSLLIADVTVKHEGSYKCRVLTVSGPAEPRTINLKVSAKYSKPNIEPSKKIKRSKGTLECSSFGGYPKGELRWFDEDNKKFISGDIMKVEQTGSLFYLSKRLNLTSESNSSKYTCMVFNASGVNEVNATYQISDPGLDPDRADPEGDKGLKVGGPEQATRIAAPLVVIGSLIIGLLVVLLLRRLKQSRQARRHSTAPLMGYNDTQREQEPPEEDKMINEA